MIKLSKIEIPKVLKDNAANWHKALVIKILSSTKPTDTEKTRYRHPEIKATLIKETNGKCAYCESKILHTQHGDVEHIYPKSLDPELTFEWTNLTLACEICNQNKSNKDPYLAHIIDPYLIDPLEHLGFAGTVMYSKSDTYGKNTKVLLDLNRAELCEMRREKLEKTLGIFENILNKSLPLVTRKAIYENLLANEGSSSSEYTAMNISAIKNLESSLEPEFYL